MPVDMNSVTTNDCRQLEVSCCCRAGILRFGTSCLLRRPEPAAISGNTSYLPHSLLLKLKLSKAKRFNLSILLASLTTSLIVLARFGNN